MAIFTNTKTKTETGFEAVLRDINVLTPYGLRRLKGLRPFPPGTETKLTTELKKVELLLELAVEKAELVEKIQEILMEIKEISFTLERSAKDVLSVIELYEIKTFLLQSEKLVKALADMMRKLPQEMRLHDTVKLLDVMDPSGDRINTFYIYDAFSEKLASLRKERRELELAVRRAQKEIKRRLEAEHHLNMTPKCELVVSKNEPQQLEQVRAILELEQVDEDYMSVTFSVKNTPEIFELKKKMEELNGLLEEEELEVQKELTGKIAAEAEYLKKNCERIGDLDLSLAKAVYARDHSCVKPEVVEDHVLEFVNGRHLVVEGILNGKGKEYCPITVSLRDGVSCITGANMGGKTVSLKLIGMVAMLAQYGFFVPCESARVGLSNYIHILIGDSQSMQRGLSSFGSEMEELKDILDNSRDRSLLLIDEIANGTNPVEGLALTKSLIAYLIGRKYITVITTHFDHAAVGTDVRNMQVRGLAGADMDKLVRELRYAKRKERIDIISKYMDYRLYTVRNDEEIPKDALNIAQMLGINEEIIQGAKEILKKEMKG